MADQSEACITPLHDNAVRLDAIRQDSWIPYPRAIEIRKRMEGLLTHPRTHRMPNLALIAETNNGKTMLLNNFLDRHKPDEDPNAEKTILPVLMVQTPPAPDEGRLYSAILETLFSDGPPKEPAESKLRRIKVILRTLETKILVMDEFNNALAGTYMKQRRFLNGIKYLGNELQIPFVAAGTSEALRAIASDPQLANRFEPVFLPKWKDDENFSRLMLSIEPKLLLREPSNLHSEVMTNLILDACEGTIGEAVKLLRLLAANAIEKGTECIEEKMFKAPYLKQLDWVRPTKRTHNET